MADRITQLADGFWRVEGSFRIGGMLDVGTHCGVARLADGGWVLLDSYTLTADIEEQVRTITGGDIRAILNLHPFHTMHCEWAHKAFPQAALYGTARHLRNFPELPWQSVRCEDEALAAAFGDSFAFSVPAGVPLVCSDESVHFSSVLALHRESGTIHVDDTLVYLDKGFPFSLLPMNRQMAFHPTLAKALLPQAGAADAFREWAIALGSDWAAAKRVAAAHNAVRDLGTDEFLELIGAALGRVKPVLDAHRSQHG